MDYMVEAERALRAAGVTSADTAKTYAILAVAQQLNELNRTLKATAIMVDSDLSDGRAITPTFDPELLEHAARTIADHD